LRAATDEWTVRHRTRVSSPTGSNLDLASGRPYLGKFAYASQYLPLRTIVSGAMVDILPAWPSLACP
jgi:hypothetical protein